MTIFTAISVYGFFYMLLEVSKFIAVDHYDQTLIFSGSRPFFNFFFAGVGLLAGQQVGFHFLASKANIKTLHKTRMINTGRVLLWVILFLLVRIFIIFLFQYKVFFTADTAQEVTSLLFWISLGILFVAFVYPWIQLRRFVKEVKSIHILDGLLVFVLLAFGLSKIQWYNQKQMDQMVLNRNVMYRYNIQLPKSEINKNTNKGMYLYNLCIGKNPKNANVEVFYENKRIKINDLESLLYDFLDNHIYGNGNVYIGLLIDKNITLQELQPVFHILLDNYSIKSVFVYTEYGEISKGFKFRLNKNMLYDYLHHYEGEFEYLYGENGPPRPKEMILRRKLYYTKNHRGVDIYHSKEFVGFEDGEVFSIKTFNHRMNKPYYDYSVNPWTAYFVDVNITFGDYIEIKSKLFKAYYIQRDIYALATFGTSYEKLNRENQIKVRKEIPMLIGEFGLNNLSQLRMNDFIEEQRKEMLNDGPWNCIPN